MKRFYIFPPADITDVAVRQVKWKIYRETVIFCYQHYNRINIIGEPD